VLFKQGPLISHLYQIYGSLNLDLDLDLLAQARVKYLAKWNVANNVCEIQHETANNIDQLELKSERYTSICWINIYLF